MADVSIRCPACGQLNVMSEFVADHARVCSACKAQLPAPVSTANELFLAPKFAASHVERGSETIAKMLPVTSAGVALQEKTHSTRQKAKGPSRIAGALLFALLAGLFVAIEYFAARSAPLMSWYLTGRYGVVGIALALILFDALRDSHVKFFLCLLVPLYIVFYALTHVGSYWRQAVFMAMLAMLGAELVFCRDESLLVRSQAIVNRKIATVSNLIQRAGDAPVP